MSSIIPLQRCFRWISRFRHRRGYGIHSPFAFNMVTGVIYERGTYYAYESLRALRQTQKSALRECDDRLLFRLMNASGASEGVVIGNDVAVQLAYLRAARRSCLLRTFKVDEVEKAEGTALKIRPSKVDFLYVDAPASVWPKAWKLLLEKRGGKAMFVVRNIHRSKADCQAWKQLIMDERVRVTFDLYDFGIACFEERFNKEDYVIDYF